MMDHVIPQILFGVKFLATNGANVRNVQVRVDVIHQTIALRELSIAAFEISLRNELIKFEFLTVVGNLNLNV
jgi:hypothetical protein